MKKAKIVIAALYQFKSHNNLKVSQDKLLRVCSVHKVKGTLLLGKEGINGTVAGSRVAIDKLLACISSLGFDNLNYKESYSDNLPFLRLKVKIKTEIVTIGDKSINPINKVGEYVSAKQWNELLTDPDVIVIDTRNDYEVAVGQFEGAVNPKTKNFREFPDYVKTQLADCKDKKIAMYCTGGIRCEKASSYMLDQGFKEVYHLEGGILKYMEDTPVVDSKWQGNCFVFDERVALDHDLQPSGHKQCYGCRHPLTAAEFSAEETIAGVCCPYCVNVTTTEQKQRYKERQKQISLANKRGEQHLG